MRDLKYYSNADLSAAALHGDFSKMADYLESGFAAYGRGEIILPEKASQILDSVDQSRVNCMPCTAPSIGYSGVKLVSVFPGNAKVGKTNVSGMVLMLDATDGSPVAVLDAGFLTALRTALVGGIAARYLAIHEPEVIGLLGSGAEALMHLLTMSKLYPSLGMCRVASRSPKSEARFYKAAQNLTPQVKVECCASEYEKAAKGADIIVTAISGQVPLLKADWVKPGACYIHVGGIEDEYGVALKADKIVCDSWSALKHRGSPTISHMYQDGVITDDDIYAELPELVRGDKPGRQSSDEFIYFNSIGMAFTDLYLSAFLMEECDKRNLGSLIPVPAFDIFEMSMSDEAGMRG